MVFKLLLIEASVEPTPIEIQEAVPEKSWLLDVTQVAEPYVVMQVVLVGEVKIYEL